MYVEKKKFKNLAVYEEMWKNMVQREKPQITIQHGAENMRFAWQIAETGMPRHTHNN